MSDNGEFPRLLTVDVGGMPQKFRHTDEVTHFLTEMEHYLGQFGLGQLHVKGTSWNNIIRNTRKPLNLLDNSQTAEEKDGHLQTLENQLSSFPFPAPGSVKGKYVQHIHDEYGADQARGALIFFTHNTQRTSTENEQEGLALACNFNADAHFDHELTRDTLADLVKLEMDNNRMLFDEVMDAKGAAYRLRQKCEEILSEQAAQFKDAMTRFSEEMEREKEKYRKDIAEKEAVTYWRLKSDKHSKKARNFHIAIYVVIAIFFCVGYQFYDLLSSAIVDQDEVSQKLLFTDDGQLRYWLLLFVGAVATMFVWIIRILVRLFFSNTHLSEDAEERATLIQTYLAMERNEQVLKQEDKELILPSIFRQGSDGIVKDDAAPPTLLTMLTRQRQ